MGVEKKVQWCLNKAKKELEESRKHRGLIQVEPDLKKTWDHIRKAEHNHKAITYFEQGGFSDWSVSAGFYCLYHCFLSIIRHFGYESRNQECTIALIKKLVEEEKINLDTKFVDALELSNNEELHESNVLDLREHYQYGIEDHVEDVSEIEKLKKLCEELIEITKELTKPKTP